MNDLIKASIEARRAALFNSYEIEDISIKNEIENLFNRIIEFGETCIDTMDFETKFASSTLNQEYIALFTKIATTCKSKITESAEDDDIEIIEDEIDLKSEMQYELKEATQPIRGQLYRKAYDEARDIPVIGDALNIKQHIDFFGKFKKK